MKLQEIFVLDKNYDRPIINISGMGGKLQALIDTGAQFPVWVDDISILLALGAKCVKKGIKFGGFGKGEATGDIYILPMLSLGNIMYPQMHIIASKMNCKYSMIISATMFKNYIYTIDDKNHRLLIDIPDDESNVKNLVIKSDNTGHITVLCTGIENNI